MSTRAEGTNGPPINSRADLVTWIEQGSKSREHWKIGVEHEKFVFHAVDHSPAPYFGANGIRALMETLGNVYGWLPIMEGDFVIGLKRPEADLAANITLEPGGQFELSGAQFYSIHDVNKEMRSHQVEINN